MGTWLLRMPTADNLRHTCFDLFILITLFTIGAGESFLSVLN
jgi:hypothetical protein